MKNGRRKMEDGKWNMVDGGWEMVEVILNIKFWILN